MFTAELWEGAVGLPWFPRRKHPFFLQASPSSTATESASVGLSMTLLFWPEKSIATREFSDMLLWKIETIGQKLVSYQYIPYQLTFSVFLFICVHSVRDPARVTASKETIHARCRFHITWAGAGSKRPESDLTVYFPHTFKHSNSLKRGSMWQLSQQSFRHSYIGTPLQSSKAPVTFTISFHSIDW